MFLIGFSFARWISSGNLLYNNVNILNNTELYTLKTVNMVNFMYLYFTRILKKFLEGRLKYYTSIVLCPTVYTQYVHVILLLKKVVLIMRIVKFLHNAIILNFGLKFLPY